MLAGTRAERVRVEAGAVRGVEAVAGGEGVAIDASVGCVAAGVLETPALLQRSGIPGVTGEGVAFTPAPT